MTTKESSFDAGRMYDEGIAEAGLEADEQDQTSNNETTGAMEQKQQGEPVKSEKSEQPAQEKKPSEDQTKEVESALKSTETSDESDSEKEEEVESIVESILPKPDDQEKETEETHDSRRVPLDDHIKLRQRAQNAEAERDEYKRRLDELSAMHPTGGEKLGEEVVEASPVEKFVEENPDEEFVPAKVQAEQIKWQREQERKILEARQRADREAAQRQQNLDNARQLGIQAKASEKKARQVHKDYDTVTKAVLDANLLRPDEVQKLIASQDIGEDFYKLAKAKLTALANGVGYIPPVETTRQPQETKETESTEEAEMSDDQIFDELQNDLFKAG
jgi:hypothetical protein